MILKLSYYWAAFALNLIACIGCAYVADKLVFTRLGRLIAGSFAIALSLAAISLLLAALQQVMR